MNFSNKYSKQTSRVTFWNYELTEHKFDNDYDSHKCLAGVEIKDQYNLHLSKVQSKWSLQLQYKQVIYIDRRVVKTDPSTYNHFHPSIFLLSLIKHSAVSWHIYRYVDDCKEFRGPYCYHGIHFIKQKLFSSTNNPRKLTDKWIQYTT